MSKMNYELAKKLQNAGFPQKGTVFVSNTEQIHTKEQLSVVDEGVYYPTLEELIEAVMKDFTKRNAWQGMGHLHFFELAPNINTQGELSTIGKVSEWRSTHSYGASLDEIEWGENHFGATPSEAVAKLLLSLSGSSHTKG